MTKILVIANPKAGSMNPEHFEEVLARLFAGSDCEYVLYYSRQGENLSSAVCEARQNGCDLVAAAGGDGTVSLVADCLQGSDTPLAIIPLGTGNVLAQELNIPADPGEAVGLVLGPHSLRPVDGMRIGNKIYLLHLGVGLTSKTMQSTQQEAKRRFGNLAYLWEGVKKLAGWQSRVFWLEIDGHKKAARAIEVSVTNARIAGGKPFKWGEDVSVDDGCVNVCVINAKSIPDYVRAFIGLARGLPDRSNHIQCYEARERIRILAARDLPVQADGEIIGETPVDIRVIPRAVQIVVPLSYKPA